MSKSKLVSAVATASALGFSASAFAAVPPAPAAVADSYLLIDEFTLREGGNGAGQSATELPVRSLPIGTILPAGTIVWDGAMFSPLAVDTTLDGTNNVINPFGSLNITSIKTTAEVSASYNGATPSTDDLGLAGVGLGASFNLTETQGPDAGSFVPGTTLDGDPTGTFVGSHSSSTGNAIVGSDTVPVHNQISLDAVGSFGSASGNQNLTTEFNFTVDDPITFELTFEADAFMRAALGQDGNASTQMAWSASVFERGAGANGADLGILAWSPNGEAGGLGSCANGAFAAANGVSCIEYSDPFTLNPVGLGLNSAGEQLYDPANDPFISGNFFEVELTLDAGEYSFSIAHSTNVNASVAVPEPMTTALLGIGLVGLGATTRRKRRA